MPRARFTVRALMVAVAVVAVALGLKRMRDRSARYKELAWQQAVRYLYHRDKSQIEARYHLRLARKYEHIGRYPWLPVETEPDEPE